MALPYGNVKVPWVATKAGEAGSVKAKFLPNDSVKVADILFKSGADGATLSAQLSGNEWTITLPSIAKEESLVVNAVDKNGTTVGKLNAIGYEELKRKVHIVPVGNSTADFTGSELTNYLNRIYAQAGATWEVEMEEAITAEGYDGNLQDDEQQMLSTYSEGMKAIIKSYKNSENVTVIDNEFYLFLVDKSQTDRAGYMPRKHQYGFIYMGESGDKQRTIAHELGHGAFQLQHPWEEYPSIAEGSSDNLMDYGTGTNLRKYQWDLIHNPPVVIGLVEDLEEGSLAGVKWFTPDWKVFSASNTKKISDKNVENVPDGTVPGFVVEGITYTARFENDVFKGYYFSDELSDDTKFNIEYFPDTKPTDSIYVFQDLGGCDKSKYYKTTKQYVDDNKANVTFFAGINDGKVIDCTYSVEEGIGKDFYEARKNKAPISNEELAVIANMINSLYENLYNEFVENGFSNLYKEDLIFYNLGGYNDSSDYEKFKNLLEKFINHKDQINDYFIEIINEESSSQDDVLKAISYLTYNHCKALDVEQRLQVLERLSAGPLSGKWIVGDGGEFAVVKLIATTPTQDINIFFEGLRQNNLIGKLNNKIDDYFFGPDNYTAFINELHKLFIKNDTEVTVSELLDSKRVLRWRTIEHINSESSYDSYFEDGSISFNIQLIDYKLNLPDDMSEIKSGYHLANYRTKISDNTNYNNLNPFEPIALIVEDKKAAEIIPGATYGETYIIPAFYFVWVINEYGNEQIKEGLKAAITVGSLAIGGGELIAAKSVLQYTIALLDIGFTLGDVVLDETTRQKVSQSNDGEAFLLYWDILSTVNNIATVSSLTIKTSKSFVKKWDNIKSAAKSNLDEAKFNKIDAKVRSVKEELENAGIRISDDFTKIDNLTGTINHKIDDVANSAIQDSENIAEMVKTNNGIDVSEAAKKFWAQHEFNVTSYLRQKYGITNVGRQITVDIFIEGVQEPIRCRLDNLIAIENGKFLVIDAKSSIKYDLSQESINNLVKRLSTKNQKSFYEALKNGEISQVKPVGENARNYLVDQLKMAEVPENISIDGSIDFFVNDVAVDGYSLYKIKY
jgi:hypothetical protein